MIEQTLRKFCESKHRLLIVIAGTFVVGLVLVLPLVDAYCAGQEEKETLTAELESAKHIAAGLEQFETRVSEKLVQLGAFETRTVNEDSLAALRGQLVELAKDTGCNIRRLTPGSASSRPWVPGQDPVMPTTNAKANETTSAFMLEWRPVSISLSGTSASLRTMLERVANSGMLMHTKSIDIYPSSPTRQSLTLDMELWYFTLARRS